MTTFVDGPAKGRTLMLKRSPKYLRVTEAAGKQEFDALDQVNDKPEITEHLYAYVVSKTLGTAHLKMGGKSKSASGFYPIVEYSFLPVQPTDAIMRSNERWQEWCEAMLK